MRVWCFLECSECGNRYYRTSKKGKSESKEKLQVKKFCPICKKHTVHKELKK